MSVDPNDIFLNDEQRRLLATAADQTGLAWQEILERTVTPLVHPELRIQNGAAPPRETAFEMLSRLGLIGCIEGTPPDLSTNKAHLEGLGRHG